MTVYSYVGSTFVAELNRLANGGTYPTRDKFLDKAAAANKWAGTTGLDTVGALNAKAGTTGIDVAGVCNLIAGTTGLSETAALRAVPEVDNVPQFLAGEAAYYIDSTAPQNWGSLGYVQLNGINDYLSTPDANALDITGDIDLRAYVALDDWTPSALNMLVSKYGGAGQISYALSIQTSGIPLLSWSADGTNTLTAAATLAPTIADGAALWIRVTFDVNNGASGRDIKFFTSTDGTTWTQLGTTVTQANTTSIFNSIAQVEIGSRTTGANLATGKFYAAQIFASIDGTDKRLDVNIGNDYKSTDFGTFYASTGQLITINGDDAAVRNLGTAGSLLPTQVGSATTADSNDAKFLDHTGTNYVYISGVTGNRLTVPDSAELDITGDIDIRVQVAMDDWTPAASETFTSKFVAGQRSFRFLVQSAGTLYLETSPDGTTQIGATSTIATGITDGAVKWVRATVDVDNGASGNTTTFFTSDDGTNWVQLGTAVTNAGTTSIFAGTAEVEIGSFGTGAGTAAGKFYRAQILDGIDGTTVLDVDTSVITTGSATSFTAVTGQTVTINRSTSGRKTVAVTQPCWLFGTDDYMEVNNRYLTHTGSNYLYLPGVSGNNAITPDANVLDITGDIDLRCKVALDDWTPAALSTLISKFASVTYRSYFFGVNANGTLKLQWSENGTDVLIQDSTVAPTIADGETLWVRATLDVDNGASGYDVNFYTSTDGTNWTQLGTTITGGSTTSIFATSSVVGLAVGSNSQAPTFGNQARGKFFRAQVLDGIDGTVAFDANFETGITSLLQTTFTESSTNAATVTINRSGSAYRSAGITQAGYLYRGATNTFTASATNHLDFGVSDSFTLVAAYRPWTTLATNVTRIAKKINTTAATQGYLLGSDGTTGSLPRTQIGDGTNGLSATSGARTSGAATVTAAVRNVTTDNVTTYTNGTAGTPVTDNTAGTLTNFEQLRIGRLSGAGTSYADMELYAAAVFRKPLTAREVKVISDYFTTKVGA